MCHRIHVEEDDPYYVYVHRYDGQIISSGEAPYLYLILMKLYHSIEPYADRIREMRSQSKQYGFLHIKEECTIEFTEIADSLLLRMLKDGKLTEWEITRERG